MSWSYRNRGHIQRTQITMKIRKHILARKMPMCSSPAPIVAAGWFRPATGRLQPPRNSVVISAAAATMLAYSPMKKSANFIELYSTL